MAESARYSYTSLPSGLVRRLREALTLYRRGARRGNVAAAARLMQEQVFAHTGVTLRDKAVLDVGCGQTIGLSLMLAQENQVVGIDLDVIPRPLHPFDYVLMVRRNGWLRTAKTISRKVLGVDRAIRRAVASETGRSPLRRPTLLTMDATHMTFPESAFDFVYSTSVFEHLPDPHAVLSEVVRVLRPGGAAYLHVHLFHHDSGAHDPRVLRDRRTRGGLPAWAHLRPEHRSSVQPNAYLNRLSLGEWRALFSASLPGCEFETMDDGRSWLEPELRTLRSRGELAVYSDEELLTAALVAIWRKPIPAGI